MRDFFDLDKIRIRLASPDKMRSWSYGEVKKPETINYRTLKPEKDGLFCEKIFGTTKDWECYCGKFKSIRYKGVICDKCGVEVSHSKKRRERMGIIELSYPVAHIWYYRTVPSRIALVLDMTASDVKSILYFEKYVLIDAGDSGLEHKQLLTQEEYSHLLEQHEDKIDASIGSVAIKTLLETVNIEEEIRIIRNSLETKKKTTDKRLLKRLEILESFRDSGNRPEWMILDTLPVLPPELRPMVALEGGRFATSDLNDLYRRVINRNNRLKRLLSLKAPEIIVCNEKRMLQEAVDALFDNSRRKKSIKGKGNRPLKSLSDMLKGKQGRFRQNLLGKRVDYSGRTVIVVGPNLKIYQCGLPKKMALELFKPFIMKWMVEKENTQNIKSAKRMIENEEREVFQGLEEIINEHPVLLNRAPTLHRLGIQAFLPVLVEGRAIQLHPLVCHAFNADFDGDQIAIHVPLSPKAQLESWLLILSAHNLLNPANGTPIVAPTQDMTLGLYYLTSENRNGVGEGLHFDDIDELRYSIDRGLVAHRSKIQYLKNNRIIETTPGRVIFNSILPDGFEEKFDFFNKALTDKEINKIIIDIYKKMGASETVTFLDKLKKLGFDYATFFAPTVSIDDIKIPESKTELILIANKEVERVENEYRRGIITNDERYKKVIEIWTNTNEKITEDLFKVLADDKDGTNSIYAMAISGARGSRSQIRQLAGMRGLMAKPSGDIIELPIRANFKEGLGIFEFFISTHGARKGLADTALKTADAGYLTRRLVDIAQDVIVKELDCKTEDGFYLSADKDGDKTIVTLKDKLFGRYLAETIVDSTSSEVIYAKNTLITEEIAQKIENLGYTTVKIRSVLTCDVLSGVCRMCYGIDLATLREVEIGEAVGIVAAQSIGQPGTQLTMRTFHIGGTATTKSVDTFIKSPYNALIKEISGNIVSRDDQKIITKRGSLILAQVYAEYNKNDFSELNVVSGDKIIRGEIFAKMKHENRSISSEAPCEIYEIDNKIILLGQDFTININPGSMLKVAQGDIVLEKSILFEYDPYNLLLVSSNAGRIEYNQIEEGKNLRIEEVEGADASVSIAKVVAYRHEKLRPAVSIYDKGKLAEEVSIPIDAILIVKSGEQIRPGDTIAKIQLKAEKTKDITGGLPRVDELFEARPVKDPCHLAECDGIIRDTGNVVRDKRVFEIIPDDCLESEIETKKINISIPIHKQILVQDGEHIHRGDQIDDGALDPHDILRVKGEEVLQKYFISEIQEVYRLQGIYINDKHIEVMIRQMMRKQEIVNPGDTSFVPLKKVDKSRLKQENRRVIEQGGAPAEGRTVLMGLTRASIDSESFLSAASFQETTKVLTDAAIKGKDDDLIGLKENIIIGHLIPAGTGIREYRNIRSYKNIMGDLFYTIDERDMLYQSSVDTSKNAALPVAMDDDSYLDD